MKLSSRTSIAAEAATSLRTVRTESPAMIRVSAGASTLSVMSPDESEPTVALTRAIPGKSAVTTPGLRCRAAGDVPERRLRMPDPPFGVRSLRRPRQERPQVLGGLLHVAPLEQQEGDPVMRSPEALVELQRALVMPDRLLRLAGLGKGDGHV